MRKPMIAANWKMNKTLSEAQHFVEEIKGRIPPEAVVDSVVCAPALFLHPLVSASKGTALKIGAENMHDEDSGAFTGEISPYALRDIGIGDVIIGHSERRQLFSESDAFIHRKVLAAFKNKLRPIICVGETLVEREAGETDSVVDRQVNSALQGLREEEASRLVIAYEPIWAIGTGKSSTAEDANAVCAHIRATIHDLFSKQTAESVRIQYGGSVKPENIGDFLHQSEIDGALVGGASLDPQSFSQLLEAVPYA